MKKNKQSFMQGVMILMLSQIIIKLAGLVYKIYLTNKQGFGDTGNAIFSAGFQVYTLFLAISSIGVPNAISQMISAKVALGDNKGAYRIFKVAISIFGGIGFIGTTVLFLNANKIANNYLGIPEAEMTIMALAPSIFIVAVSSVLRGYFNGREKIRITANSQSLEQILKTILTIIMVEILSTLSKKNTATIVAGAAIAATISTFFSFAYLYILYFKNKQEIWKDVITSTLKERECISRIIKNILYISFPITITSLLATANKTIDTFTIVNIIGKYMDRENAKFQYGILSGKVEGLVVLPYSFNIAFAITLVPTISAAQARGEITQAIKRIKFSILATILISLPCTAILFIFAEPILKLLFPNAYLGKTMLKLSSLSIIFVAITQTIGGVLQGLKRVKEPAIAIGIGAIVKLTLNVVLLQIKDLNINGAIISTIISHIITFIISFYYLKKYVPINFNIIKFVLKPIVTTTIMVLISLTTYSNLQICISQNVNLIFSLIIGGISYIIAIVFLRILSKEEICMLPYGNKIYKTRNRKIL